jgi:hypothetical protein
MLPTTMSNRELIDSTVRAARNERCATVELLALLGELDERRLYLGEGCSSLFTFCTQVLHLSEHAAYHRIEAARVARRFPVILSFVAEGALTLTSVAMLRPHLTAENHVALLAAARHKSKREVEQQIASLAPKPDAKTLIRRIPESKPNVSNLLAPPGSLATDATGPAASTEPAPAPLPTASTPASAWPSTSTTIAPLSSERYLIRVTLSAEAHANLRRAQDLMRHTIPTGDPAAVLERALELLVDRLIKVKVAKSNRSRNSASRSDTSSRYIPARVRRAVWTRDCGRCAFVGGQGRCTETGQLEYHHLLPYAHGGPASVENIALRCRAHNSFESEAIFGRWQKRSVELGPDRVS